MTIKIKFNLSTGVKMLLNEYSCFRLTTRHVNQKGPLPFTFIQLLFLLHLIISSASKGEKTRDKS